MTRALRSVALALALLGAGCEGPAPVPVCEGLGVAIEAAGAPERRFLGEASDYPADGMLASRWDELSGSMRARRAMAWDVIARVVAPVAPAEVAEPTVPRFRTWYDVEDFRRVFSGVYEAMGADRRASRDRPTEAELDAAFDRNLHVLDGMAIWTPERWASFVADLDTPAEVGAAGGLLRVAMSPGTTRHVARSYPEILRCRLEGSPPAFVDGPASPERLTREGVNLEACGVHVAGPFWVASGARIEAHLEGPTLGGASLALVAGETVALGETTCTASEGGACTGSGPGGFYVVVSADGHGLSAVLDVTYASPEIPFAGCLDGVFPLDSVTVAQEWNRVELGPMATFDTSGPAIAEHLAGEATWGTGEGTADPGPEDIFTIEVPAGGHFRLAGMHIRTRELDHWVNITMWWSPDPDATFGADRPDSIRALGGPWANYAMCVSIDDVERDPDPQFGFGTDHPDLGEALAAAHDSGLSWCSNPYIDAAPGLVRTNCVGCHQHGMSGVLPGEVVMDEDRYPMHGRVFVRNNFPADQFWGLDAGDDLAYEIQNVVDYWATAP